MQFQRASQIRTAETVRERSAATSTKTPLLARAPVHPILRLQRTIGNQAVQRLIQSHVLQAKLSVSQPGDMYEQEADRVAEHVMRMPAPTLQRACAPCAAGGPPCPKCEDEKIELVQPVVSRVEPRKTEQSSDTANSSVPDNFLQNLGPGQPLDSTTRAFFEPRFGYDFSGVWVHTDAQEMKEGASKGLLTIPKPSFKARYADPKGRLEESGQATCDPDKGKVTFKINYGKFPLCMADCVYAHEKAHAEFGQAECSKVSAAAKAAADAVERAKKSGLKEDLEKAEQAVKDFEKAKEAYDKWIDQTCRADEEKAYQAGIDKCKTSEIQKQCADFKETPRYTEIMKQWENFKKNPPNCAPPSGSPAPPTSPSPEGTIIAGTQPSQPAQLGPAQAGQTQPGGPTVSFTMPKCTSTTVKNWISGSLFGLTTLSGAGGTAPEFKVEPVPGGKSVKVRETSATLQPIDVKFLAPGEYPDNKSYQWQCDINVDNSALCPPGTFVKPQVIWDVTADGSARLAEGEDEHCVDFQLAFYLTLGRSAEIVNDLARSGRTFPNEAAARAELQKSVKLDPKDWVKYFACLGQTTGDMRDKPGWHTPVSPVKPAARKYMRLETTPGGLVAKVPIILPHVKVGEKWVHSPWDVIQAAASTCNVKIPWIP